MGCQPTLLGTPVSGFGVGLLNAPAKSSTPIRATLNGSYATSGQVADNMGTFSFTGRR
jgi:hypothetical protein